MREEAFRVRRMENKESGEVSWPWKRDALVQGETHACMKKASILSGDVSTSNVKTFPLSF
jgi:hypothetical protein